MTGLFTRIADGPTGALEAADVAAVLRRARYRVSTEGLLHESIAEALVAAGVAFERERRLTPGERIDFLVAGGVGIEAKARYNKRGIYRQLQRYAALEAITGLVLVTGTAIGLPGELHGKPLHVVSTGRAML